MQALRLDSPKNGQVLNSLLLPLLHKNKSRKKLRQHLLMLVRLRIECGFSLSWSFILDFVKYKIFAIFRSIYAYVGSRISSFAYVECIVIRSSYACVGSRILVESSFQCRCSIIMWMWGKFRNNLNQMQWPETQELRVFSRVRVSDKRIIIVRKQKEKITIKSWNDREILENYIIRTMHGRIWEGPGDRPRLARSSDQRSH